jgi:hypothetical protein
MTASLMISENRTLAARSSLERMTGIEPALSAWESTGGCNTLPSASAPHRFTAGVGYFCARIPRVRLSGLRALASAS